MEEENNVIPSPDDEGKERQSKKTKGERKAAMVATIILFVISSIFSAVTFYYLLGIFVTKDKAASAIGFIVFVITFGWITYIPAFATAIAGICTGTFASRSTLKTYKKISIVFLVLNILLLISLVIFGFLILLFPSILN